MSDDYDDMEQALPSCRFRWFEIPMALLTIIEAFGEGLADAASDLQNSLAMHYNWLKDTDTKDFQKEAQAELRHLLNGDNDG